MKQEHQRHRRKWYQVVWNVFCLLLFLCVSFSAGYGLSVLIFRLTGQPNALLSHIVSSILGLFVIAGISQIIMRLRFRSTKNNRSSDSRFEMMDRTIEALNKIARGDFSVFVPVDERDPFSELAESVNQMALELGSMENLRQDFISNVSHEIQSPLTSISGFAALLKHNALTPEQRVHYLDVIETEAKRLSRLSDNLLKLSALENNVQPLADNAFALNKQIQNAALMLEPQWTAKHLNLDLTLERISFAGDEGLLSQVWINLLHNAIKFTPDNGEISILLSNNENNAVCRVSDTGVGISPEDQIHIFERFYKADKSRDRSLGGNGLGLSLVKKIVELHGGTLTVESELGKGTAFTVSLPLKK